MFSSIPFLPEVSQFYGSDSSAYSYWQNPAFEIPTMFPISTTTSSTTNPAADKPKERKGKKNETSPQESKKSFMMSRILSPETGAKLETPLRDAASPKSGTGTNGSFEAPSPADRCERVSPLYPGSDETTGSLSSTASVSSPDFCGYIYPMPTGAESFFTPSSSMNPTLPGFDYDPYGYPAQYPTSNGTEGYWYNYAENGSNLSGLQQRKGRRNRTVFTDQQITDLENWFSTEKYLSTTLRCKIAEECNLTEMQVKTWYQNRRMKWKKEMLLSGVTEIPTKSKGRPKKVSTSIADSTIYSPPSISNNSTVSVSSTDNTMVSPTFPDNTTVSSRIPVEMTVSSNIPDDSNEEH